MAAGHRPLDAAVSAGRRQVAEFNLPFAHAAFPSFCEEGLARRLLLSTRMKARISASVSGHTLAGKPLGRGFLSLSTRRPLRAASNPKRNALIPVDWRNPSMSDSSFALMGR